MYTRWASVVHGGGGRGQGEQALSSTVFFVTIHGVGRRKPTKHGVGRRKPTSPNFRRRGDFPGLWFLPPGICLRHLWKISPASEERCLVSVVPACCFFFFLNLFIKHLVLKKKKGRSKRAPNVLRSFFGSAFSSSGYRPTAKTARQRKQAPNTVEKGGIISGSEMLVNILLGSRATDTVEVVVVGNCQGRAEREIAIPSAFGDPKKPLSVEINLSKSP